MKTLLNPWFTTGCLIWLTVILLRKLGHPLPLISGYVDDAFAIPVIANLALWFQRVLIIKNNYYVLSPRQVIFIVVYVSIVFEGLLPWISAIYTADWVDVMLYAFGGCFFYWVMNKPLLESRFKSQGPRP